MIRTSRSPIHDSARFTSKLSCAHFRALCASFAARSDRFCCRCICTMSATLRSSSQHLTSVYLQNPESLTHPKILDALLITPMPPHSTPHSPILFHRAAGQSNYLLAPALVPAQPVLLRRYPMGPVSTLQAL